MKLIILPHNSTASGFKLFSGSSNLPLAKKLAFQWRITLSKSEITIFSGGEKRVRILEDVKNQVCVFLQSMSSPTDENWVETLLFLDALKRNGASKIVAVIPYLGYQKQDKQFRSGEAVSVAVVAKTLEAAGMDQLITFNLHSPKILEYFQRPLTVLSAFPLFLEEIKKLISQRESLQNYIMVAPDKGSFWTRDFTQKLGIGFVQIHKKRDKQTSCVSIEGWETKENVKGKTAILIDNVVYTGQTLMLAANFLKEKGVKKVLCYAAHAMWNQKTCQDLQQSKIDRLTVTDTIFTSKKKQFPKLKIISIANLLTKATIERAILKKE